MRIRTIPHHPPSPPSGISVDLVSHWFTIFIRITLSIGLTQIMLLSSEKHLFISMTVPSRFLHSLAAVCSRSWPSLAAASLATAPSLISLMAQVLRRNEKRVLFSSFCDYFNCFLWNELGRLLAVQTSVYTMAPISHRKTIRAWYDANGQNRNEGTGSWNTQHTTDGEDRQRGTGWNVAWN